MHSIFQFVQNTRTSCYMSLGELYRHEGTRHQQWQRLWVSKMLQFIQRLLRRCAIKDRASLTIESFLFCSDLDSALFFGRPQRQMHFSKVCTCSLKSTNVTFWVWLQILGYWIPFSIPEAELIVYESTQTTWSLWLSANSKPSWTPFFFFSHGHKHQASVATHSQTLIHIPLFSMVLLICASSPW